MNKIRDIRNFLGTKRSNVTGVWGDSIGSQTNLEKDKIYVIDTCQDSKCIPERDECLNKIKDFEKIENENKKYKKLIKDYEQYIFELEEIKRNIPKDCDECLIENKNYKLRFTEYEKFLSDKDKYLKQMNEYKEDIKKCNELVEKNKNIHLNDIENLTKSLNDEYDKKYIEINKKHLEELEKAVKKGCSEEILEFNKLKWSKECKDKIDFLNEKFDSDINLLKKQINELKSENGSLSDKFKTQYQILIDQINEKHSIEIQKIIDDCKKHDNDEFESEKKELDPIIQKILDNLDIDDNLLIKKIGQNGIDKMMNTNKINMIAFFYNVAKNNLKYRIDFIGKIQEKYNEIIKDDDDINFSISIKDNTIEYQTIINNSVIGLSKLGRIRSPLINESIDWEGSASLNQKIDKYSNDNLDVIDTIFNQNNFVDTKGINKSYAIDSMMSKRLVNFEKYLLINFVKIDSDNIFTEKSNFGEVLKNCNCFVDSYYINKSYALYCLRNLAKLDKNTLWGIHPKLLLDYGDKYIDYNEFISSFWGSCSLKYKLLTIDKKSKSSDLNDIFIKNIEETTVPPRYSYETFNAVSKIFKNSGIEINTFSKHESFDSLKPNKLPNSLLLIKELPIISQNNTFSVYDLLDTFYEGFKATFIIQRENILNLSIASSKLDYINEIINKPDKYEYLNQFWIGNAPFCDAEPIECKKYGNGLYKAVREENITETDKLSYVSLLLLIIGIKLFNR